MISFELANKGCPYVKFLMARHYSKPKGFVARQIVYRIKFGCQYYGAIVFGSAIKNLDGREIYGTLQNGMNNIFYHVYKVNDRYPLRIFTTSVLLAVEPLAVAEYHRKYNDRVTWIESLVELPRSGELYRRAGYIEVGMTKGFCCKREGGLSTDTWTGRRVWSIGTPKRVFQKVLM